MGKRGRNLKSTEAFINECNVVHNNFYCYDKTIYTGINNKIKIICPIHGEFEQIAKSHLKGCGCQMCAKKHIPTTSEFIDSAIKIHGNKYDYSRVKYINSRTNVCIICPEHGEFWQTPHSHLKGFGCKKCSKQVYDTGSFITKAKKIHGDKYDYSKVNYVDSKTKVCIICPEHGEFWQRPDMHLSGHLCPFCNISILENELKNILKTNNINFIIKADKNVFNWLDRQHLDFYLPDYNIAIECQGEQHFKPIKFFGGISKLEYTQKMDNIKKEKCEMNNIKLLYYSFKTNKHNCFTKNNILENIIYYGS
jgi:hypothetical protein